MQPFYEIVTNIFDPLHALWERSGTKRTVAATQVAVFLAGVAGIELNRRGLLPAPLARLTPLSHYYAINLAFTLVLIQEVIDLIFILPCSVSKSVGKQFEILCLILLRGSFKELVHFAEPISLTGGIGPVLPILADGAGALGVYLGLGFYYRLYRGRASGKKTADLYGFVSAKKFLALILLGVFFGLGAREMWFSVIDGRANVFFETFYTVLIFSDILIVLVSHAHQPHFHSVFRNSGFALVTLLIRFALAAPPYIGPILGLSAMSVAVGLTATYNAFSPEGREAAATSRTASDVAAGKKTARP